MWNKIFSSNRFVCTALYDFERCRIFKGSASNAILTKLIFSASFVIFPSSTITRRKEKYLPNEVSLSRLCRKNSISARHEPHTFDIFSVSRVLHSHRSKNKGIPVRAWKANSLKFYSTVSTRNVPSRNVYSTFSTYNFLYGCIESIVPGTRHV